MTTPPVAVDPHLLFGTAHRFIQCHLPHMRLALFSIIAILLASSCGPMTLCASSNCMGCCESPTGRCLSGQDVAFCGVSGAACKTCASGEVCTGTGACVNRNQPCGPSTCSGCCNASGVCVSGQLAAECGNSGNACMTCLAIDMCVPSTGAAMGGLCQ